MKRIFILLNIIILLIVISCSQQLDEVTSNKNTITLNVISQVNMRSEVVDIIEGYLDKFPHVDNFTLICYPSKLVGDDMLFEPTGKDFLIGPAYEMTFYDKSPILFYKIKNKKIFIKCGIEELYSKSSFQDSIYHSSQIKRGVDSINIDSVNWTLKNGEDLYINKALYFSINKTGEITKNERPDTLFIPKLLPSTVSFDTNKKY
jgi:hypothetical protein